MLKAHYSFEPDAPVDAAAEPSGSFSSRVKAFAIDVLPAWGSGGGGADNGTGGAADAAEEGSGPSWLDGCCALSYAQRLTLFAMCAAGGLAMFGLSSMYFMRIFIGSPGKFALTWSLGNLLLLGSTCFLVGPSKQLSNMFAPDRYAASLVYLLSMMGTMYTVLAAPSVLLVFPMVALQVCSLLWYVASYLPWGRSCLSGVSSTFARKLLGW